MPVVLDGLRARLGQVGDLMGVPDPRSRAPASFLPHPQVPSGKCEMVPSG